MAFQKLIEDWYASFNYKISSSDLQKATPAFLSDVLQCFLRHVHIDIDKLKLKFEDDDKERERQFRICVVAYINSLLEVTSKNSNNSIRFIYGDLILPQSKKTVAILKLLHNYYLYFTMVEADVVGAAHEQIEKYNQLLSERNQQQIRIEELKIDKINKERTNEDCKKSIADNKKLLDELNSKRTQLLESMNEAKQKLQSVEAENIQLNYEMLLSTPLVVPEIELTNLAKSIEDAKNKIVDLTAIEQRILESNERDIEDINHLNAEIEVVDMGLLNALTDQYNIYLEEEKKLSESKRKVREASDRRDDVSGRDMKLRKTIEVLLYSKQFP